MLLCPSSLFSALEQGWVIFRFLSRPIMVYPASATDILDIGYIASLAN